MANSKKLSHCCCVWIVSDHWKGLSHVTVTRCGWSGVWKHHVEEILLWSTKIWNVNQTKQKAFRNLFLFIKWKSRKYAVKKVCTKCMHRLTKETGVTNVAHLFWIFLIFSLYVSTANDPCKINPCPAKVTTCKYSAKSYVCVGEWTVIVSLWFLFLFHLLVFSHFSRCKRMFEITVWETWSLCKQDENWLQVRLPKGTC
jgi:hypothetical protein